MMATPFFNEQVRQAYLFSCFCGLRISDIRKLRWRDLSMSGGQWRASVVMTKTIHPVYIPLSSQAVKWLPERGDCTPDGLVFGGLPNEGNLCVNLKNWAEKAGVKKNVTFHTARHSCAVLLLTLGADIYTVSKILGHRSVRSTLRSRNRDKRPSASLRWRNLNGDFSINDFFFLPIVSQ